jgi:integrase
MESESKKPVEHHAALCPAEISESMAQQVAVEELVWLTKSLACGLRPSEVLRLAKQHLVNDRVVLKSVIQKTKTDKRPPATEVLRLCLELEGLLPPPVCQSVQLDGVQRYALRTTLATHLIYCGLDFNAVAEFLGHATAEMALRTYAVRRPPGAVENRNVYYSCGGVSVGGRAVATSDSLYHQFLLQEFLKNLQEHYPIFFARAKQILLGLNQPEVQTVPVASF